MAVNQKTKCFKIGQDTFLTVTYRTYHRYGMYRQLRDSYRTVLVIGTILRLQPHFMQMKVKAIHEKEPTGSLAQFGASGIIHGAGRLLGTPTRPQQSYFFSHNTDQRQPVNSYNIRQFMLCSIVGMAYTLYIFV